MLAFLSFIVREKVYEAKTKVITNSINSNGDHSKKDHPSDISSLINKPGIARTHNPLKIFEPIRVPDTVSYLPSKPKR